MDDNLGSLIKSSTHVTADVLFYQMLQALDYLAFKGVIHRDVKPENIFCNAIPNGGYYFRLGDFGLSNRIADARTFAGTGIYMAPEFFSGGEQTNKSDIYSLYVTMIWVLNISDFRLLVKDFNNHRDAQLAVSATTKDRKVRRIQKMAALHPTERPSAAEMLIECFQGSGLTTPRSRVVRSAPRDEDIEWEAPAPTSVPTLPTRAAERQPVRGTQNRNLLVADLRTWRPQHRGPAGIGRVGQHLRRFS